MTSVPGIELMYRELQSLSLEELSRRFQGAAPEGPKYAVAYYHDVALAIRRHGKQAVDFLLRELPQLDAGRARGVLFAISCPPELPGMAEVLVKHLLDKRSGVVMEAIEGLRHLRVRHVRGQVLSLRQHRSPYVRGAVLRYLARLFPQEAIPAAEEELRDRHYIVRDSAVDVLDDLGAVSALPVIRPLLTDRHPHVRQAARTAVRHLEELSGARRWDPDAWVRDLRDE